MIQWLTENWLAAYAALVGTVALGVNFVRFLHLRKRDTIQLKVGGKRHHNYEAQLKRLREDKKKPAYERLSGVQVYKVRVTNTGSIPAHLEDAGVITTVGQVISVLTHCSNDSNTLCSLASSNAPAIEPKSFQDYWIWLMEDQEPFEVASYFAIDKTGKKWNARAKSGERAQSSGSGLAL